MARYALNSLIAGLALPPLLCGAGSLTFFLLCSTLFSSLDSLVYAICGSGVVMLLLAPLAGWRLVAGQTLPPTLAERYGPLLLLPPLIYLMALSVFWSMLERPNLSVLLFYVVGAGIPWCLFALGVFWGVRKSTPARQVGNGLLRMAGYTGLAAIVIGANLYDIVDNTLYRPRGDAGKDIYLPSYLPSVPNNHLVRPASPPSLRIVANYPRLNGEVSLLPLYGAVARAVYGVQHDKIPANHDDDTGDNSGQALHDPYNLNVVNHDWSLKRPMSQLVRNWCDIAFGDLAAAQEFTALAVREGREAPELTPIAWEALVFFVQKDNPVHDLHLAQLGDIYAGKIRSWEDVGGPDTRIFAFQTDDERTQQALANMVMHGRTTIRPLMDPTASVADYCNRPDALGYAFFWRANRLFPDGEIRLLSIDGIAPTPENIRSGRYPLTFPLVMATRQSPHREVRDLMDWICGPEGQALIDRAGFVSLKGRASEEYITNKYGQIFFLISKSAAYFYF